MSTSRLASNVRNLVICCDRVSELCGTCNPVHAFLWFDPTPGPCCFRHLTQDLPNTEENIVIYSELRIDDSFLSLCDFATVSSPASVTAEGSLSSRGFSLITYIKSPPALGAEENASYSLQPSVDGFNRSDGTKFSMLHSITFLPPDKR